MVEIFGERRDWMSASKFSIKEIEAEEHEDQAEEATLQAALQNVTKLKASLEQATALLKKNEKEFADSAE
jgi:hypothetical protein